MAVPDPEYLADTFATVARAMEAAPDAQATCHIVIRSAVELIPGCDYASITLIHDRGRVDTVAATDEIVNRIDAIQYELGEGPCLGAITDEVLYDIEDLQAEDRWPRFTRRATTETDIASVLALRLFTSAEVRGALNLYSKEPHAFDAHSRATGEIMAAHAAIALLAANEHDRNYNLQAALENSRTIGIAIGILMNSQRLDREQAFRFLVDVSQRLNSKLRDVAGIIADAGGIPDHLRGHSP